MHTHTARPCLLIPCRSPFAWSSEPSAINSVLLLTHSAPSDSASSDSLKSVSLLTSRRVPLQVDPDGGRNPRLRCKQAHHALTHCTQWR